MVDEREEKKLRVFVVTFNVSGKNPNQSTLDYIFKDKELSKGRGFDFIAVGLQEVVEMKVGLHLLRTTGKSSWHAALEEYLKGFKFISGERLLGLELFVFQNSEFCKRVNSKVCVVKLGEELKKWSKGSICSKLEYSGNSLCFIVSHFAAHHHRMSERKKNYDKTCKKLTKKGFLEANSIFWFGDFNYRLELTDVENVEARDFRKIKREEFKPIVKNIFHQINGLEINPILDQNHRLNQRPEIDQIPESIPKTLFDQITESGEMPELNDELKKEYRALLDRDQLKAAMHGEDNRVFEGFSEHDIYFLPTYKINQRHKIGKKRYESEKNTVPGYTDRILYKGLGVVALRYKSIPKVNISDHIPVCGTFEITEALKNGGCEESSLLVLY